jgi:serpin B
MRGVLRTLALLLCATGVTLPGGRAKGAAAALAESSSAFAFDLYRAVHHREGNLFFSPYSVSVALAMTRAGAAGETASQMDAVLHLPVEAAAQGHRELARQLEPPLVPESAEAQAKQIPAYELNIANALWGQEELPIRKRFLAVLEDDYGAPLARVDFTQPAGARERINAWVEEETRKRIRNLIPEAQPSPNTRLALANAIYLKASWEDPFKVARTADGLFTTPAGDQVTAHFMHQTESLRYAGMDDLQVLSLPYRDRRMSMIILLPRKTSSLAELEAGLDAERVRRWLSELRPTHVHVALPRFEFESSFDLTDTLAGMGMPDAFDADRADFSQMSEVELFISLVLHKAFVAVDEEGTEAAAATAALMMLAGEPPRETIEFRADHPFLFFIQHRDTGAILFLGRVVDPTRS